MGDNGKIEDAGTPIKTQEQLDKERSERFIKEPFSFIEINELVCAVVRNPKSQLGISVIVGYCKRSELNQAQSELHRKIERVVLDMDKEVAVNQSKIIPAKGSFLNFARRR